MYKSLTTKERPLLECINPTTNDWVIRFDLTKYDSNTFCYMCETFTYKPNIDEIKTIIINYHNEKTRSEIMDNFYWSNHKFWLSIENQINYKSLYDATLKYGGSNLPKKIKCCDDDISYFTFNKIEEVEDFYLKMTTFISNKIENGWDIKDSINWDSYNVD